MVAICIMIALWPMKLGCAFLAVKAGVHIVRAIRELAAVE